MNYMDIPEHTRHSLMLYIVHGYKPGRGLQSILGGDLFATVRCCDDATLAALRPLVTWVHSFAHSDSHGSADKVEAWLGSPKKCYDTEEGLVKLGFYEEATAYASKEDNDK